jgi:hypothetical protein
MNRIIRKEGLFTVAVSRPTPELLQLLLWERPVLDSADAHYAKFMKDVAVARVPRAVDFTSLVAGDPRFVLQR